MMSNVLPRFFGTQCTCSLQCLQCRSVFGLQSVLSAVVDLADLVSSRDHGLTFELDLHSVKSECRRSRSKVI